MRDPFFSIIVPCYNIEKYIIKCLVSLVNQTFRSFEIIIIDDGSTDRTGLICDEYRLNDNRINVIHQCNNGVSVARNIGIDTAKGDWIIFVDPDDWLEINALEIIHNIILLQDSELFLFDYFQEYKNRCIEKKLFGESKSLDEKDITALRKAPFNQFIIDGKQIEYETNVIWNKVYKTSVLRKNKLIFDSKARKGQDVIFNAEAFQVYKSFYYIHCPLYHYRYIETSITNRYNPNVRYYNEIAFKHYERIIKQYNLPEQYYRCFYVRVLTRLYSCLRLYYFHKKNTMTWKQKDKEIKDILMSEPYKTASLYVSYKEMTLLQVSFIFCLKHKMVFSLWFLTKLKGILQYAKGKVLS